MLFVSCKRFREIISIIMMMAFLMILAAGCKSGPATTSTTTGVTAGTQGKTLLVFAGAGLNKPVDELGKQFQEKTGITVQFTYGGSAQCVSQILTVGKGDLFLPGDVSELKPLIDKGLVVQQKPLVYHVPVLGVPKGNPAHITSLQDLAKPGIKVALGDPQANPMGKLSDKVLQDLGIFDKVSPHVVARAATCDPLITYLSMKQVDAALIWEDSLQSNDKIEAVNAPELKNYIKKVPATALKCSQEPELAAKFLDFLSSPDGTAIWEKWGFKPVKETS